MLATSSCLYAVLGCACLKELQLAVSNCSTCMLYLGEQELLKTGATKDRCTSETSGEHPILYIQK